MLPRADTIATEGTPSEAPFLDLSKLLGFRDLAGVGSDEGEMAAALDAVHVKIGTEGIPGGSL